MRTVCQTCHEPKQEWEMVAVWVGRKGVVEMCDACYRRAQQAANKLKGGKR